MFWTQKSMPFVVSELCAGQSSKCNNSKLRRYKVIVLALLIHQMISIYLQSFLFISVIVSELCPGQSSKCKYEQRAIAPKSGNAELWLFCTAPLPNVMYLPTKLIFISPLVSELLSGQSSSTCVKMNKGQ
jgi:hypothetical protein